MWCYRSHVLGTLFSLPKATSFSLFLLCGWQAAAVVKQVWVGAAMSRWSAAVTKGNCGSAVTEQRLTVGGSKSELQYWVMPAAKIWWNVIMQKSKLKYLLIRVAGFLRTQWVFLKLGTPSSDISRVKFWSVHVHDPIVLKLREWNHSQTFSLTIFW